MTDFLEYVFIVVAWIVLMCTFLIAFLILTSTQKEHKRKRESMNKISFEIVDDAVIKYTQMPEIRENVYKTEVVMTKEIFQECYKKWIMSQESEEKA